MDALLSVVGPLLLYIVGALLFVMQVASDHVDVLKTIGIAYLVGGLVGTRLFVRIACLLDGKFHGYNGRTPPRATGREWLAAHAVWPLWAVFSMAIAFVLVVRGTVRGGRRALSRSYEYRLPI